MTTLHREEKLFLGEQWFELKLHFSNYLTQVKSATGLVDTTNIFESLQIKLKKLW